MPPHHTTQETTVTTHRIDTTDLTVYATGPDGETHDINATGEPCRDLAELADFVRELHEQGYFDQATRDELLAEIGRS
jgi:hypothetical protein